MVLMLVVLGLWQGRARSAERWPFEATLGQFSIHSDFEIASQPDVATQLGSLKADLEQTLRISIHHEPVHLILFAQQSSYQEYMNQYFPDVPARRALFIKRRGPGMVFGYQSEQLLTDLRHETTHALLNASLPYVPLWLDEGLAEYFETLPTPGNGAREHEHRSAVARRAFWNRVPSVQRMESLGDLAEMGSTEYQNAWSIVQFLLHDSDQSRAVIIGFLQQLQSHSPPGLLSQRMDEQLPDWKRRYLAFFRR